MLKIIDKIKKYLYNSIAKIKKGTKDENLASEFLTTFSKTVGIDTDNIGEPNGVLAKR